VSWTDIYAGARGRLDAAAGFYNHNVRVDLPDGPVIVRVDHPHPKMYQGDAYQQRIDQGKLTAVVRAVTGHGLDRPFQELLDAIAPPPRPQGRRCLGRS